jgi:hypothetical protein
MTSGMYLGLWLSRSTADFASGSPPRHLRHDKAPPILNPLHSCHIPDDHKVSY